jgi:chromosomal replication initiator protein
MDHPVRTDREGGQADELSAQWDRIRARLQSDVGEVEYRSWLRQMTLAGLDGDEITVHLPNRFHRDWVREHYGARISSLWQAENPCVRRVDIRMGGDSAGPALDGAEEPIVSPALLRTKAAVLAEDRGIRCATLDYDALRGAEDGSLRLF